MSKEPEALKPPDISQNPEGEGRLHIEHSIILENHQYYFNEILMKNCVMRQREGDYKLISKD